MSSTIYQANQGPSDSTKAPEGSRESKLLARIRRRFDYMVKAWQPIRDKAALDMRALSDEGPWDPKERAERIANRRPVIHLDQLDQYVNSLVNEVRLNPIGVKVEPDDEGTDENTAELTGDRLRQIEYESNATQAYRTALQCAVERSYGVFGVTLDYRSWDSLERIIRVRRFPNPDTVLWDPNCKEVDGSDMEDAFVLDRINREDFTDKYPNATHTSFNSDLMSQAPAWFGADDMQIAEYWYIDQRPDRVFQVQTPDGPTKFLMSELEGAKQKKNVLVLQDGTELPIIDWRVTQRPVVCQCLTNGVEILDELDWSDMPSVKWIPIFPVLGKEKWMPTTDENGRASGTERVLESYIRKAIDGQMLFDFYKTNEAEEVGQTPKSPWWMYDGQDEGHEDELRSLNKVPRAYQVINPVVDPVTQQVLPLPQRSKYEPAIQALEIGAESARRAIQAAVGSYGFSKLDDTNVKSGKAIGLLDRQADTGSFHFIDNYKATIAHAGRVMGAMTAEIETEPLQRGFRKRDGTHDVRKINQKYRDAKTGEVVDRRYRTKDGAQHRYIVTTGPSYNSQREQASEFVEKIIGSSDMFPILGDLLVKLKDLGPIGDAIAERLEKMLPPALKDKQKQGAIPPELQQQMQQQAQMIQQLTAALNAAHDQIESKQLELAAKMKSQAYSDDVKLAIAELNAKVKMDAEQLGAFMTKMDHTLQLIMQSRDQAHELEVAAATPPAAGSGSETPAQ